MVRHLLPLIPEHEVYVEVFGGSAALLFAKEPSPVEVYNDIDDVLVNFFRVMRDKQKSTELLRMLKNTPYSRQEFDLSRKMLGERMQMQDVEMAYRLFLVLTMARNGSYTHAYWSMPTVSKDGTRPCRHYATEFRSAVRNLYWVRQRMRTVNVEKGDFQRIIELYDSPSTFFYIDPPYVEETRRYDGGVYGHDMSIEEHSRLLDLVRNLRGKAMISGYDSVLYEQRLEHWHKLTFVVAVRTSTAFKGERAEAAKSRECVWLNYEPNQTGQLGLFGEGENGLADTKIGAW